MKKNWPIIKLAIFPLLAAVTILTLLTSCAQSTTTTSVTTSSQPAAVPTNKATTSNAQVTTTPATTTPSSTMSNWWDKFGTPQYGGTISYATTMLGDTFDPYMFFTANFLAYEQMFMGDLTLNPNVFSYKTSGYPPKINGLLAKSWEFTDPQTLVIHLREDVKWQNKAPTNGREFTADDVVYHYDRELGLGNGFTKPSPFAVGMLGAIAGVSTTDKYTVTMKFKAPHQLANWWTAINPACPNMIEPREQVESGHPGDLANSAGTGPFMPSAYTSGSSITWVKNPDYYLNDERYPDNQLPYIDTLKEISIMDPATRLAALRTGQVDFADNISWRDANQIKKTNPDIMLSAIPSMGQTVEMRLDKKPFDDIRVREALQLAINIPAIAKSIYGGYVSSDPPSWLADSPDYAGYTRPYKDWPADLQQEYTYNPTEAKKLLAEAGYPNGFDTNILIQTSENEGDSGNLYQAVQAEFAAIGVNMTISAMDRSQWMAYTQAGKFDQMVSNFFDNQIFGVDVAYSNRTSASPTNVIHAPQDLQAKYDDMYQQFLSSPDEATAKALAVQMEEFLYRQHWAVVTTGSVSFTGARPSLDGYAGENLSGFVPAWFFARFWVSK